MTILEFLVAMKWPLTFIVFVLVLAYVAVKNNRNAVPRNKPVPDCTHETKTSDKV